MSSIILIVIWIYSTGAQAQCPPPAPVPIDGNSPGPYNVDLFADQFSGDYSYLWYSQPSGGTPLENPNEDKYYFQTPFLIQSDTFYVSSIDSTCPVGQQESIRKRAIARIDPAPYPDPADHSAFGDGQWYVYCYNDTSYNLYSGFYIDTHSNINSTARWLDSMQSPYSGAVQTQNYQGAMIKNDFHSISYKKKNFPAGIYRIDIDYHDDYCELLIDGKSILYHKSYGHPHYNVWTGPLNSTSTVQFKWLDYQDASIGRVTFTLISQPVNLQTGSIPDSLNACVNQPAETLSPGNIINAYKDAYTDKDLPDLNFGNGGLSAIVKPVEYIYLAFDISNIDYAIENVNLVLTSNNLTGVPNTYLSLYGVTDTTWQESQLTWNNQPPAGQYIDSTVISDSRSLDYVWNITNYIQSEINAGRKNTAVLLKINGTPKSIKYIGEASFNSKESSKKPHLLVNGSKSACTYKTFQWQSQLQCSGAFSDIPQATNNTYTPAGSTQKTCYRLKLIDECGNIAYSDTTQIAITNPTPPTLTDTSVCKNSIATLKAIGTTDSYNWYTMATNGNLVNKGNSYQTPALNKDTSFFVAGVNGNCVGNTRTQVKISQNPSKAGDLTSGFKTLCGNYGNKDTIVLSNYSTGGSFKILSSTDDFKTNQSTIANGLNKVEIKNLTSDTYFKSVVDNGKCPADTSKSYLIKVNYNEPGKITVAELSTEKGLLKLEGYAGQIVRWETSDDEFKTSKIINNTSPELNIDNTLPLYFRAIVQAQGCPEDKSDSIKVGLVNLYSSFTPNGDGINETWVIDNIESTNNNVTIFNRWGELVFEIDDYDNSERVWKGIGNKGIALGSNNLPDGTYFYVIKVENEKPVSGYIILKR